MSNSIRMSDSIKKHSFLFNFNSKKEQYGGTLLNIIDEELSNHNVTKYLDSGLPKWYMKQKILDTSQKSQYAI